MDHLWNENRIVGIEYGAYCVNRSDAPGTLCEIYPEICLEIY